jgi:hypothetical protein
MTIKMKRLPILLFLLLSYNILFAQTQAQSAFKTAMDIMDKQPENYLAPVNALKNIKVDTTDIIGLNMWLQAMMTYYSFLGDYQNLLFYSDARIKDQIDTAKIVYDAAFVENHTLVNAADYITSQAKRYKVTMINEAHHLPYHRVFAITMLKKFYDSGYHYLAIETLLDSLINQKKYPDYATGYYTHEPVFGEMLRQAMRMGFTLVPYEAKERCDQKSKDPNYCNRFRDSLMAVNLTKILRKEPNAKILVYAGYDHIHEGSSDSWKKMAQFFREFTGIDPFTVELTMQVEHLYPQLEQKEFISVNKLRHIQQPVIAIQNNKPWHSEFVDATVLFPTYIAKGKRPSFYSFGGLRKFYNLNRFHLKSGQFVQAFYSDEKPGNRIPADQLVINNEINGLYLFKGRYVLVIKNNEGTLTKEHIINVN